MSPFLYDDLKIEEGCSLTAYPDPKWGWNVPTIGYGHTGREVHRGLVWTQAQADSALVVDVGAVATGLATALPWIAQIDPLREDVLLDMAFNMGVHKLTTFTTFLSYVEAGQYSHAALDMMGTPWYHEVGERGIRLEKQMGSGVHFAPL